MLQLNEQSIIYVHIPSDFATGGVELLHQLVHCLRDFGRETYCVYYGKREHVPFPEYTKYNLAVVEDCDIVSDNNNIEVYSETMLLALNRNIRCTQKMMWWMSVDNFYTYGGLMNLKLYEIFLWDKKQFWYFFKHYLKLFLKGKNEYKDKYSIQGMYSRGITFCYQCEYIHQHLRSHGVRKSYPLSDYLNVDYLYQNDSHKKENIVLYNPAKGFEFTKMLIQNAPDITWVALKGFSREELCNLMRKAKVYIDFGNHPGKDRLPRECAINGCCIITGKRGSAGFVEDVNIPSKYKFKDSFDNIDSILCQIRYVFNNYEVVKKDFIDYKKLIQEEKVKFEDQICELFCINKN